MANYRKMLKAKIHRATVTHADLNYEGSVTLSPELLEASGILEFEAVQIWNVTRGTRFETYAMAGEADTENICVNGAAAHLAGPGDKVIIAAFIDLEESFAKTHRPVVVFVDENNRQMSPRISEIPGPNVYKLKC